MTNGIKAFFYIKKTDTGNLALVNILYPIINNFVDSCDSRMVIRKAD